MLIPSKEETDALLGDSPRQRYRIRYAPLEIL